MSKRQALKAMANSIILAMTGTKIMAVNTRQAWEATIITITITMVMTEITTTDEMIDCRPLISPTAAGTITC